MKCGILSGEMMKKRGDLLVFWAENRKTLFLCKVTKQKQDAETRKINTLQNGEI